MSDERFLKKLIRWSTSTRDNVSVNDYEEYKRSILDDVLRLYNTQKGTALIDSSLGVPDFSGLMNRFGAHEADFIAHSLKEVTDNYEPRMRSTSVMYSPKDDDYSSVRFNVNTHLLYNEKNIQLEFSVLVNGNGSVTIDN